MDRFDNRDNPAKLVVILPGYGTSTSVGTMPRSIPCLRADQVSGYRLTWRHNRPGLRPDVRVGSFASTPRCNLGVRFTPDNGRSPAALGLAPPLTFATAGISL